MNTPMQEAEGRAGVQSADELLAERQVITDRLAPLFALFGPGGMADTMRRSERARIAGLIRAMAVASGQKMTEAGLEEAAASHADYLQVMAEHTTGRAEYFKLNAQLEAVDFKLQRGQAVLRFVSSELRT
jgi:hypothetical protein